VATGEKTMKVDFVLYGVSLICIILSAFFFIQSFLVPPEMKLIIPLVLAILGLVFVGLGYLMRSARDLSTPLALQLAGACS
jgi:uncharacterized membrane-anchored protein